MAQTAAIALVAGDWVELPTAAQFTLQNTGSLPLTVKASTLEPTTTDGAHILEAGRSMTKLADEKHWVWVDYEGGTAAFTENDLT